MFPDIFSGSCFGVNIIYEIDIIMLRENRGKILKYVHTVLWKQILSAIFVNEHVAKKLVCFLYL